MSRLDELKKQYPELTMSMFDIISRIDTSKTYKYTPLLCKLLGEKFNLNKEAGSYKEKAKIEFLEQFKSYGIDISNLSNNQLLTLRRLTDHFDSGFFPIIKEFIQLMDDNKIENKDVTSYSNVDDLRSAITLSSLKQYEKELESQVIREFEDDTWLIIRPLTFSASAKYGSSTRWCTTYNEKYYFERYWRQGILAYIINKKTGYKVAGYKQFDTYEEEFVTFWSAEDKKLDFFLTNIDDYLFPVIKKLFSSKDTNKNLCTDEMQEQVYKECVELCGKGELSTEEPVEVGAIIRTMGANLQYPLGGEPRLDPNIS